MFTIEGNSNKKTVLPISQVARTYCLLWNLSMLTKPNWNGTKKIEIKLNRHFCFIQSWFESQKSILIFCKFFKKWTDLLHLSLHRSINFSCFWSVAVNLWICSMIVWYLISKKNYTAEYISRIKVFIWATLYWTFAALHWLFVPFHGSFWNLPKMSRSSYQNSGFNWLSDPSLILAKILIVSKGE